MICAQSQHPLRFTHIGSSPSTPWRLLTDYFVYFGASPARLIAILFALSYTSLLLFRASNNTRLFGMSSSLTRLLASLRCEATRIPTVAPPHSPWHGRLIGYTRLRPPSRVITKFSLYFVPYFYRRWQLYRLGLSHHLLLLLLPYT